VPEISFPPPPLVVFSPSLFQQLLKFPTPFCPHLFLLITPPLRMASNALFLEPWPSVCPFPLRKQKVRACSFPPFCLGTPPPPKPRPLKVSPSVPIFPFKQLAYLVLLFFLLPHLPPSFRTQLILFTSCFSHVSLVHRFPLNREPCTASNKTLFRGQGDCRAPAILLLFPDSGKRHVPFVVCLLVSPLSRSIA